MAQVYRKSRTMWLLNSFRDYQCPCGETELVCLEWYPNHKKIRHLVYRYGAKTKERQQAQQLIEESTALCRNCVSKYPAGLAPFVL